MTIRRLKAMLYGFGVIALSGVAFACVSVAILALQARQALIDLPAAADAARSQVMQAEAQQFAWLLASLNAQGDKTRDAAVRQIELARRDLDARLEALSEVASAKIDGLTGVVDQRLSEVTQPTGLLLADSNKTVNMLRPQALGLVAASKIAAGQMATTMRDISRAMPAFIEANQKTTEHIEQATGSGAAIVERVRKHRPWWLRILGL